MNSNAATRREGFALAVALGAIVVIGGLIAGVFYASTQEFRIGRNSVLGARALTAAEYGMNALLTQDEWNADWNTSTATGEVLGIRHYQPDQLSNAGVRITNLGNGTFLVVSTGNSGAALGASARKQISMLVSLNIADVNMLGALTTQGQVTVGGSSVINGNDVIPDDWDPLTCGVPGPAVPGIVVPPGTKITENGSKHKIDGQPPIHYTDSASNPNTYQKFGDVTWDELVANAKKLTYLGPLNNVGPTFDPAKGDVCNIKDPLNWGDPKHVHPNQRCRSYFPIIYAPGNLKLTGGYGQGILLVDGNLDVQGGFEFYGPVIVRGRLSTQGGGSGTHFHGGVLAQNVELEEDKVAGSAVINYSSCVLRKALEGAAQPIPVRDRPWADGY